MYSDHDVLPTHRPQSSRVKWSQPEAPKPSPSLWVGDLRFCCSDRQLTNAKSLNRHMIYKHFLSSRERPYLLDGILWNTTGRILMKLHLSPFSFVADSLFWIQCEARISFIALHAVSRCPGTLCWKDCSFPAEWLQYLAKTSSPQICRFLSGFSVLAPDLSVFLPVPHCFDYCSCETRKCESFYFVLLKIYCCSYSGSLAIPFEF